MTGIPRSCRGGGDHQKLRARVTQSSEALTGLPCVSSHDSPTGTPYVGHMQQIGGAPFGPLPPAVVASGGGGVGVSRQLLDRGDIRSSIQEIADPGAAQVMW